MRKNIVVFGSFVVDLMGRTPHFPAAGETVIGTGFQLGPGGKGFNQAVAAHKAGASVRMVTKVGNDTFAGVLRDTMASLRMDDSAVLTDASVSTGAALIMVSEQTGQNEIVVVPGSCMTITDEEVDTIRPLMQSGGIFLTQLETNLSATLRAMRIAKECGMQIVLNTAPVQTLSDEFYALSDLITPNEVEAAHLSGIEITDEDAAVRAAEFFMEKGVKTVLITLGTRGSFVHDGTRHAIIPARKVQAVDTTGAGDAFNGGLVAALSEGKDLWEAVRFATALASLSVQRYGTTNSMPTRAEIDAVL